MSRAAGSLALIELGVSEGLLTDKKIALTIEPSVIDDADLVRSAIEANGLDPYYENDLLGFSAHDYQHYNRFTRNAKTLAWQGNDAIARDDLRLAAENYNFSFHQYANDQQSPQECRN